MLAEDHLCDMIRFLEEVRGILFYPLFYQTSWNPTHSFFNFIAVSWKYCDIFVDFSLHVSIVVRKN